MRSIDFSNLFTFTKLVPSLSGSNSWRERAQSLTTSLPTFLAWQAGTNFLAETSVLYETWANYRLASWSQASSVNFTERIRRLHLERRQRLLTAPQFFLLLRANKVPGAETLVQLEEFIQVEEYLCGLRNSAPSGSWSALGDYSISSPEDPPLRSKATPKTFLVRGILLDGASPYMNSGWMNPSLGDLQTHTKEEFENVRQDVERSFDLIQSVNQTAAQMIKSCVSVIVVAKGCKDQESHSSMSARRLIGLMTLANLHRAQCSDQADRQAKIWPTPELIDSLVHEAIHSMIYRIELFDSFYADEKLLFTLKVTSPWSGRELSVHSFVHACFVWFGLYHFWRMSEQSGLQYPAFTARARDGFLRGDLSGMLTEEVKAVIRPHVRNTISEMFAAVRSSVNGFAPQ